MDTDPGRWMIEGQLSAMRSRLLRVDLMHVIGYVFESEAMGNGNGRITAEERSDTGWP